MRKLITSNAVFHAFARYAALSLSSERTREAIEEILRLGRLELGLRYLAVGTVEAPASILAAGSVAGEGSQERMLVKSTRGSELLVEYQFDGTPEDDTRRDVAGCLAQLFEQANVELR